jgi:hypothetical protein
LSSSARRVVASVAAISRTGITNGRPGSQQRYRTRHGCRYERISVLAFVLHEAGEHPPAGDTLISLGDHFARFVDEQVARRFPEHRAIPLAGITEPCGGSGSSGTSHRTVCHGRLA